MITDNNYLHFAKTTQTTTKRKPDSSNVLHSTIINFDKNPQANRESHFITVTPTISTTLSLSPRMMITNENKFSFPLSLAGASHHNDDNNPNVKTVATFDDAC
jgi:hypothetical protein